MMHEKLIGFGGAHVTLLGVGPSYEGEGHIGFCEKGTPPEQACFIGTINDYDATFHIAGAHAKEFAMRNFKIASEDPYFAFFFGKNASRSQLTSSFKGKNNATGGRSGDYIYFLPFKLSGDKATQLLSKMGVL